MIAVSAPVLVTVRLREQSVPTGSRRYSTAALSMAVPAQVGLSVVTGVVRTIRLRR